MSTNWKNWLLKLPRNEFVTKFSRSGGPGGQNVNKVSTKAMIRLPNSSLNNANWATPDLKQKLLASSNYATKSGDIIVTSETFRSQKQNLEECFEKLAKEIVKVSFKPSEPSNTALEKWANVRKRQDKLKRESKQRLSQKKQDRKI